MKSGMRARLRFTEGLGFRLAFLLTLALLPLGLIALAQTWRMANEAERASELALSGRTAEAAAGERGMFYTALGAAEVLAQSVLDAEPETEACERLMRNVVERNGLYTYAAFVRVDGIVACSSQGEGQDMRASRHYQTFMAAPGPLVTSNQRGMATGQSVIIISQPVARNGTLLGYAGLSIPHDALRAVHGRLAGDGQVSIMTFNNRGELTSAEGELAEAERLLPAERELADLASAGDVAFRARSRDGEERVFNTVTIIPGLVYALGSWKPQDALLGRDLIDPSTLLFPLTMWLTSLVVAYFAVYRLVIRHVRRMRGQMRRFALGQRDVPPEVLRDAPAEIHEVSQTFHNLARILIRDEAELAHSLSEKTVLLKEVHHRVKNNLQLIASIMNMQIRQVKEPNARRVLKSVQDRVASLATIHRNLYQAETLSAVQADKLLSEIVNQMAVMSVLPGDSTEIRTDFAPVTLYPDQAVPVSLLATEALTNAIKYSGPAPGTEGITIAISLVALEDDMAELRVVNSCGPIEGEDGPRQIGLEGGLGSQLIAAFAAQLGTEPEITQTETEFTLSVRFEVVAFDPAGQV